jgi:hypothetical protein
MMKTWILSEPNVCGLPHAPIIANTITSGAYDTFYGYVLEYQHSGNISLGLDLKNKTCED